MPNLNDAPREVTQSAQSINHTATSSSVRRTHPMLIVAAGAVTLFCGVGVGVMTGIIPSAYSSSSANSSASVAAKSESLPLTSAITAATAAAATAAPVVGSVAAASTSTTNVASNLNPVENKAIGQPLAKSTSAVTTASHHTAKSTSSSTSGNVPGSVTERAPVVAGNSNQPNPVYAQNNVPVTAASAPKAVEPVICQTCGTISSVNAVAKQGEGSGAGAVLGGVLGGLLGHQVGKGHGKDVATVAGAVGGAVLGNTVEKNAKTINTYEVRVRMDDNTFQTVRYDVMPGVRVGDKVRVENGRILPN